MSKYEIPYGRHSIDQNDIDAVVSALRGDRITQGGKVEEFEKVLSSYCGSKYAVAVSSGTAALHLACIIAGVKAGDEVITTPITFAATSNMVLLAGGKTVFADIGHRSMNIDPEEIVKKITKKTKAIIPVHFSGFPCDMDKISKIAREKGIFIIEDACHALGAKYASGETVGSNTYCGLTVLSFHPVKHITTGEGGAVLTNDYQTYKRLIGLRSHGIYRTNESQKEQGLWYYEMMELGFNYRITDIQCALGISQLKKSDVFLQQRTEIAGQYNRLFDKNSFFTLPFEGYEIKSSWHFYPIKLINSMIKQKREIVEELYNRGIFVQSHYIPVYLHPYYQSLGYGKGICPRAEEFFNGEISLPLFPTMRDDDVEYVAKNFLDILKKMQVE
ncbi:UDP-4-keto-6-deoxy-N-acetylglucosamine 4-aminotransferase [Candidatus Omnitrophus magneticus]|uniref:UDP-4-keto-6-deoxy-N-acetylglucosamine 4-aminotransferase n=1 Tax=Candidatus Omnitrophus magneticus TaxID=1609969 RepID=A0A0F0CS13_9BACT|nr:UDP-4-keto-6-deoxy-N-acetylglucosamine 4-aminotransferase [Candidatus Omnitrophus magneticus]